MHFKKKSLGTLGAVHGAELCLQRFLSCSLGQSGLVANAFVQSDYKDY